MIIYIHAASNNSTIKRFTKFTSIFKSKKHVVTQKHLNFIPNKAGRQPKAPNFGGEQAAVKCLLFLLPNRCPLLLAFVDFLVGLHCFRTEVGYQFLKKLA
jgi:hypothetical protein